MPVTYQIVGCSNPRGAEGIDYACNRTVKTGDCTIEASNLICVSLSPSPIMQINLKRRRFYV